MSDTMRKKIERCAERLVDAGKLAEIMVTGQDWEFGADYLAVAFDEINPTLREVVAFAHQHMRQVAAEERRGGATEAA